MVKLSGHDLDSIMRMDEVVEVQFVRPLHITNVSGVKFKLSEDGDSFGVPAIVGYITSYMINNPPSEDGYVVINPFGKDNNITLSYYQDRAGDFSIDLKLIKDLKSIYYWLRQY